MRYGRRLLTTAFALLPFQALAAGPAIEKFTLKNGLEVVVVENHRVPAVSHMLWFRIGSADDPPMKSGLAHYHEHMMFKGTAKFTPGRYEALIAAHGGKQNAFTNYDATGYYVDIAKDRLPLVMELEADRMRGLKPDPKEALKEREVIMEERRARIENSPTALLGEQMNAALYLNHPYHTPVIGWMHEMAGLTPEDALEFHRRYYHPDNAVLVISGDVTAREIRPLADKYYGNLPKKSVPERIWKEEPPSLTARRVVLRHANVKQPIWSRDYSAPSLAYGDKARSFPLMALAQVLGAERTGILYRRLVVERKLATGVSADYSGFTRGPAEFSLSAVPAEGVSLAQLEEAVEQVIAHAGEDIADDAVARAKEMLKAESVYSREGLQTMAYLVGTLHILGLEDSLVSRWPELIADVSTQQVREALALTLKPEASVTGWLLPADRAAAQTPLAAGAFHVTP